MKDYYHMKIMPSTQIIDQRAWNNKEIIFPFVHIFVDIT